MKTIDDLRSLAEKERCAGNRDKFLELQKEIDRMQQEKVLSRHKQYLSNVEKEFGEGTYIPELRLSVRKIENGCGTKRGWINIYLNGKTTPMTPQELRKKIRIVKEENIATEYFKKLDFNDKKLLLCIGEKNDDTIDNLIRMMTLDLTTIEEYFDYSICDFVRNYDDAFNEAIEDGYTNEEAVLKGEEAESEAMEKDYLEFKSRNLKAINYLLNFHDLLLSSDKSKYYLKAKSSWRDVADCVSSTISGQGMFDYKNGKELKDIGPYKTYCNAVIEHLHWLKYYPEIYGYSSYKRIAE